MIHCCSSLLCVMSMIRINSPRPKSVNCIANNYDPVSMYHLWPPIQLFQHHPHMYQQLFCSPSTSKINYDQSNQGSNEAQSSKCQSNQSAHSFDQDNHGREVQPSSHQVFLNQGQLRNCSTSYQHQKPPFSYIALIAAAIKSSPGCKITLSGILI